MRWLDRIREKHGTSSPAPLTKLIKGGSVKTTEAIVSFVNASPGASEVFESPRKASLEGSASSRDEIIRVSYQTIWFDYDLPNGAYTPEQLQQAQKTVKRGLIRHYTLTFEPAPARNASDADPEYSHPL